MLASLTDLYQSPCNMCCITVCMELSDLVASLISSMVIDLGTVLSMTKLMYSSATIWRMGFIFLYWVTTHKICRVLGARFINYCAASIVQHVLKVQRLVCQKTLSKDDDKWLGQRLSRRWICVGVHNPTQPNVFPFPFPVLAMRCLYSVADCDSLNHLLWKKYAETETGKHYNLFWVFTSKYPPSGYGVILNLYIWSNIRISITDFWWFLHIQRRGSMNRGN